MDTTGGFMAGGKRGFGQITKLPSGRHRARYSDPEGRLTDKGEPIRHAAPFTFDTRGDAEAWLADERRIIVAGDWAPPKDRETSRRSALSFGDYAESWLPTRKVRGKPLAARTRAHYRWLLDTYLLPTFGQVPLKRITSDAVDAWYETTAVNQPTSQAHAYGLLRTILGTAVDRNLITTANPAKVKGAGHAERVKQPRPASLAELETIVAHMPHRYQLMALLASWCALRFGELAELRRSDVDTKHAEVRIRRGVVRAGGEVIVKSPKSEAGSRDVAIPPHLMPLVREHLLQHAEPGKDGLLFPARSGGHLAPSSLFRVYYPARESAGRGDLRWHDLRHTGAVLAAQTGATLAELMLRLGHKTPGAAMRYQHAAADRDREIARRLSAMVEDQA